MAFVKNPRPDERLPGLAGRRARRRAWRTTSRNTSWPDEHVAWFGCAQGTPEGVEDNGSLTRVAAFPIGIDPDRFARALERSDVRAHIAQLLNRYAGRKVP